MVDDAAAVDERRDEVGAVAGHIDRVIAAGALVDRRVGAIAAVDRDGARPGHADAADDRVGVAERVDVDVVLRLGGGDLDADAGAVDADLAVGRGADVEAVRRVGALDDHVVGHAVGGAVGGAEVGGHGAHAGAAQVADGDGVAASDGADADLLEAPEVHVDRRDVAREACASAVGGDADLLTDVGAVEVERVGARGAVDRVTAVARIPFDPVVAAAAVDGVVADVAVDVVVAGAAEELLGAGRAAERVVARAAVDGDRLVERAAAVDEVDAVVAALGVHLDLAERAAVEREVGRAVVADVEDVGARLVDDRERLLAVVTEDLQRVAVELRAGGGGGGSGGDGHRRDGDQARSPYQARGACDGPAMWVSGHTDDAKDRSLNEK